jgi:epoxyqueuosine reductase
VCPWNQKVFGKTLEVSPKRSLQSEQRHSLLAELREILTLSGKKLEKKFENSPLQRAGPFGLRRNAIIVAANQDLRELQPEISRWLEDEKLKELAQWALSRWSA